MNVLHGKHRRAEIIFWSVAGVLLLVFALYTIVSLRFLLARVTSAIGETASAPPLLVHFDFATVDRILEGKALPAQAP